MTGILAGLIGAGVIGLLLVTTILCVPVGRVKGGGWILPVALGFPTGIGICSIFTFLLLMLTGRVIHLPLEAVLLAAVAGFRLALYRRGDEVVQQEGERGDAVPDRGVLVFWLVSMLLSALWFVLFSLVRPNGDWDAWAIWNLRARFLLEGGDGWKAAFDPAMEWSHPDYPLLLPLAVARLWAWGGMQNTAAPVVIAAAFTGATTMLLFAGLRAMAGRTQALVATVVLFGVPYFVKFGAAQQADLPVAAYTLAAAVALTLARRPVQGGRGWYVLAGLCAGLAGWTKNEGLVVFLLFGVALLLTREERPGLRRIAAFTGGAAPVLACIALFKLQLSPPSHLLAGAADPAARLLDPSRYALIGAAYAREIISMGMALPVAAAALLLGRTPDPFRRREGTRLLVLVALLAGSHIAVYIITPYDLAWHLSTSLNRLLVQLWPTFLFALFLLVRFPGEDV